MKLNNLSKLFNIIVTQKITSVSKLSQIQQQMKRHGETSQLLKYYQILKKKKLFHINFNFQKDFLSLLNAANTIIKITNNLGTDNICYLSLCSLWIEYTVDW